MQSLILPLSHLFQLVLELFYSIVPNYGLAIILLSSVVSVILLPLQLWADKLQQKDLREKDAMRWELDSIKSLSNAQKKFYYTKEIYRRYGYNPIKSMRSLVGLLIQLPFFLAAYFMLGSFEGFSGQSFLIIKDLASPDKLLKGYNFLPLLMTLVNLLSAGFYLLPKKNLDRSTVLSQLLLPLLFLILLYNKSSALLLYWTCNNIFSLAKNYWQSREYIYQKIQEFNCDNAKSILLKPLKLLEFLCKTELVTLFLGLIVYLMLVHFLYNWKEASYTIDNASKVVAIIFDLLMLCSVYKLWGSLAKFLSKDICPSILQKISMALSVIIGLYVLNFHLLRLAKVRLPYLTPSFLMIILLQLSFILLLFYSCTGNTCKNLKRNFKPKTKLKILELFYLTFLPSIILLNLVHSNLGYFTIGTSAIFLLVFILAIALVLFVLHKCNFMLVPSGGGGDIYHIPINSYVMITVVIITNYILTPSLLPYFRLNNDNSLILQICSYLVLASCSLWLFHKHKKFFYTVITGIFVFYLGLYGKNLLFNREAFAKVNTIGRKEPDAVFYQGEKAPDIKPKRKVLAEAIAQKIKKKPSIYLLIYDGYPNEIMMDYYGIDNQAQFKFIKDNGFVIYPESYSLSEYSVPSIASVLELNLPKYIKDADEKNIIAGNSITNYVLQNEGYLTYNLLISNAPFLGREPVVNYTTPNVANVSVYTDIIIGLLYGEFKFQRNSVLAISNRNTVLEGLEGSEFLVYEQVQNIKFSVFTQPVHLGPRFVYSHGLPEHSQNSGKCLPNETELFYQRLQKANQHMRQDISAITNTDKNAVIIIAGDHGPGLTRGCGPISPYPEEQIIAQDIADRLGVFLAIKWLGDYRPNYEIKILQDVIPAVFSYMTGENIMYEYGLNMKTKAQASDIVLIKNGIIQYGKDKGKPLYYWVKNK